MAKMITRIQAHLEIVDESIFERRDTKVTISLPQCDYTLNYEEKTITLIFEGGVEFNFPMEDFVAKRIQKETNFSMGFIP